MNVNQLIEMLSNLSEEEKELKVMMEGCDCYTSPSELVLEDFNYNIMGYTKAVVIRNDN